MPSDKGLGQSQFGKIRQVILLMRQSLFKSMGKSLGESLHKGKIFGELLGELLLLGEMLGK
jgi:hypothetical protein